MEESNLDNYHLPNVPNLASEEDVRSTVRESGLVNLFDLVGQIETVTSVPTHTPVKFEQQFKIYVDSLTSPTVKRLYFYSNESSTWVNLAEISLPLSIANGGTGSTSVSEAKENLNIKFGGNGSDGALLVSSGTTTIDLGNAAVVVKNYTSISIIGTGKLAFSNPHDKGTIIILKAQLDVNITSSTAPCIDVSGMGGQGGSGGVQGTSSNNGLPGNTSQWIYDNSNHHGTAGNGGGGSTATAGTGGAAYTVDKISYYTSSINYLHERRIKMLCGSGGGGGGGADGGVGGSGGSGGGGLIIECAGDLAFSTANGISVAGKAGGNGSAGIANHGGSGGGGGGSAGLALILANTISDSSGSVVTTGGAGGNGGNTGSGTLALDTGGAGGGGAGNIGGAGGNGGNGGNNGNGSNGSNAGGTGAGGGGGGGAGGTNTSSTATGGTGGSAGASSGYGIVAQNIWFS